MNPGTGRPATPAEALEALLEGNRRFVTGSPQHPNQDALRRTASALGQDPFAVLLGCSDSRVAAEIVFDRGLGDLFVVRTAGHLLGPEVMASIEYGVSELNTPLVVILGHDRCGAVTAAVDAHRGGQIPSGNMRVIVERIGPEVLAAEADGITDRDAIGRRHIRSTAGRLLESSAAVREAVDEGRCAVVGLTYALADGRVHLVDPAPADAPPPSAPPPAPASVPAAGAAPSDS